MYNEVIKELLRKLQIVPEDLLVLYLRTMFPDVMTENLARQQIYSACRSRIAFKKGNYIAISRFVEPDSSADKLAKAFRIAIHFLPESRTFVKASSPWLLSFPKGSNLIQVCYIENGMEFVTSKMIAEKPVPLSDREEIKRIAIIENVANLEKIKAAGFVNFCTVENDFVTFKIAAKCAPEEAWADVPEK